MENNTKRVARKIISFQTVLVLLFSMSLPSAYAEVQVREDTSVTSYFVHGAVERSFYPKSKIAYLNEGEANWKEKDDKNTEVYGDVFYRSTDDSIIDTQKGISLERAYCGFKNNAAEAVLGDFYTSFSDYSMGNALKGGKVEIYNAGSFKIIGVGGIDTSRWEDLWEDRNEDSLARKYVWGTRLETSYFKNQTKLNFNYAGSQDDWAHFSINQAPALVEVFTMDWNAKLCDFLNFLGEVGESYSDADSRMSDIEPKFDSAMKAALDYRTNIYELKSEYSRIGEHYNTTSGFISKDLESLLFDGNLYLPSSVTLTHYLHMDRDNLKKLKYTTTKQINPGARLSFNRLPMDFRLNFDWDARKRFSTDDSCGELTSVYGAGLSRDFKYFYANARYALTTVENYKSPEQDRMRNALNLGFDGSLDFKKVIFYWSLGEDLQLERYSKIGECKQDLLLSHTGSLRAVLPSSLTFEGRFALNDNDYYMTETDSNTNRYHLGISQVFHKDFTVSFNYDQNDYYYASHNFDYFEIIMSGKLACKF